MKKFNLLTPQDIWCLPTTSILVFPIRPILYIVEEPSKVAFFGLSSSYSYKVKAVSTYWCARNYWVLASLEVMTRILVIYNPKKYTYLWLIDYTDSVASFLLLKCMQVVVCNSKAHFYPFKVENILKGSLGFNPITFTFSENSNYGRKSLLGV